MEKKELIGRKVVGFMFDPREYPTVPYSHDMIVASVGLVGKIISYHTDKDTFYVHFPNVICGVYYPAVLIKEHLLDEEPKSDDPLDNLPLISGGILMEVSDDGKEWHEKIVLGRLKNNCFLVEEEINYTAWAFARPIPKTKITRKEFEAKFEIID